MFNGEKFYRCGNYFQHNGKRLHRTVWEYHHGKIPKGYHVHHKDGNKANNSINNLELMKAHEHESMHGKEEGKRDLFIKNLNKARIEASKWHGSKEGFEFHSKLAKSNWKNREPKTYVCSYCGNTFQSKYIYSEKSNRFCNQNCKASFRRKRLRDESCQC